MARQFRWDDRPSKDIDHPTSDGTLAECHPYGGTLSVKRAGWMFKFVWFSKDISDYWHSSPAIYASLYEAKQGAQRFYNKKFRSTGYVKCHHMTFWARWRRDRNIRKGLIPAPVLDPIEPPTDMLQRLLEHLVVLPDDHSPFIKYNDDSYKIHDNPHLNSIISDHAKLGWGAYEQEMYQAMCYDKRVIPLLIRHMQTYPKRRERERTKSYMISRSLGNSNKWHENYLAREKVKNEEISERYAQLGIPK